MRRRRPRRRRGPVPRRSDGRRPVPYCPARSDPRGERGRSSSDRPGPAARRRGTHHRRRSPRGDGGAVPRHSRIHARHRCPRTGRRVRPPAGCVRPGTRRAAAPGRPRRPAAPPGRPAGGSRLPAACADGPAACAAVHPRGPLGCAARPAVPAYGAVPRGGCPRRTTIPADAGSHRPAVPGARDVGRTRRTGPGPRHGLPGPGAGDARGRRGRRGERAGLRRTRPTAADSPGALVASTTGRRTVLLGVPGAVVVDTPDALLVTTPERAQAVKGVVDRLRADGREELL